MSVLASPRTPRSCSRRPRLRTATCGPLGHHQVHPTADGGLSASKPGLRAGTQDLARVYRLSMSIAIGLAKKCERAEGDRPGVYKNHVTTRPMLAAKMATTVAPPSAFIAREFTRSPM